MIDKGYQVVLDSGQISKFIRSGVGKLLKKLADLEMKKKAEMLSKDSDDGENVV